MVESEEETIVPKSMMAVRRVASRVGLGLIGYTLITYAATYLGMLVMYGLFEIDDPLEDATGQIAGVVLGVIFLLMSARRWIDRKQIFAAGEKMSFMRFFGTLCLFMCGQLLFILAGAVLDSLAGVFGYTVESSIESATADSTTISMFLYTGLVAPVGEELIYRGFVLRSFQRFGRVFSIVASALLFGIMHANLPQSIYAFYCGLILGYVAERYSIRYSILLHTLNNLVFGEMFLILTDRLDDVTFEMISGALSVVFLFGGFVALMYYGKRINAYFRENRTEKGVWSTTLTTFSIIVFALFHLMVALITLDRL